MPAKIGAMKRAYRVDDIRAAEQQLLDLGAPLMEHASYAVAMEVIRHLKAADCRVPGSTVMALVGAGNNGADALYASAALARRGLAVTAICCGEPHAAGLSAAQRAGVRIIHNPDKTSLEQIAGASRVWIDGLLGIGARGAIREPLAGVIRMLNHLRYSSAVQPWVLAVDVPSGVGIDDGTLPGVALCADVTVTMGAAKRALYLPPACEYAGRIVTVPLGFEPYLSADPALVSLTAADVRDLWKIPGSHDHKYTRGVLGILAGSRTYPGAGMLCVAGARAVGIGMVRYLGEVDAVVTSYPDVVCAPGQVQAWALGSGLDSLDEASRILHNAFAEGYPVVCDARAIELIYDGDVPSTVVITPHAGELAALLRARGEDITRSDIEAAPARAVRLAAALTGATVVLKGAVNVIAAAHGPLYAQGGAPGWLASAGAGDVLAGTIGALLAMYGDEIQARGEHSDLVLRLAAGACCVHAQAAQDAAQVKNGFVGRPITAGEVAEHIAQTIFKILGNESYY